MNIKDKALKLALEALEYIDMPLNAETAAELEEKTERAITAIKEALVQPQQEPVAQFHVEHRTNACSDVCDDQGKVYATCAWHTNAGQRAERICNLLNIPPPQRKPLTDDEVLYCWKQAYEPGCRAYDIGVRMARTIEAAHGIKE